MSKAQLPGGQDLEEILASIRKNLAGKATGSTGNARSEPAPLQPGTDARAQAVLAAGASNRAMPVRGAGVLNGEGSAGAADPGAAEQGSPISGAATTGAANGRAHGYPPVEPSLADLLADVAAPPPSIRTAEAAPGSKQGTADSDPLWFLGPKPAKSDGLATERAPVIVPGEARTSVEPSAETSSAAPAPEDVKLTQPEALRRSFPPLFGVTAEAPLARVPIPTPDQVPIPVSAVEAFVQRIKAPFFETQRDAGTRSEPSATALHSAPAGEERHAGDIAPMPAAQLENEAERPEQLSKQLSKQLSEQAPEQPREHLSLPEQIAGHPSGRPSEGAIADLQGSTAPDVPVVPPAAAQGAFAKVEGTVPAPVVTPSDAPLQPEPATAKSPFSAIPAALRAEEPTPAAAYAAPGSASGLSPLPPTQGLQAAIAHLLEPVLRQWVEITLPRLVETAIREEVSRQLSKPRGELKI